MLILLIILLATWFYFKNNCTCKKNKIKEGFNSDTINYCEIDALGEDEESDENENKNKNNIEITIQELNNHINNKKLVSEDQKNIFDVVEKLIDENTSQYRTDNLSNLDKAIEKNKSIIDIQNNMKEICETIYINNKDKDNICKIYEKNV